MESTVLQPHTRTLQHIPRWAIIRTLRQQSVAEHSYYVAIYAAKLADELCLSKNDKLWCMTEALTHDFEEMVTGDIPSPYRSSFIRNDKEILSAPHAMHLSITRSEPELGDVCKNIIEVADVFEACMFLADEFYMGNSTVKDLLSDLMSILEAKAVKLGSEIKNTLIDHVNDDRRTRVLSARGLS